MHETHDGRPHLHLVAGARPTTGRELMAEGCRMLAEWLTERAEGLTGTEALAVAALIAKLLVIAGS